MSGKRYPEEFIIKAVKQVIERGHSVSSVATRLDITTHSLYAWIKRHIHDGIMQSQESNLTSWPVEFIDFYLVGFLLVPTIVPPNDFACGVLGILSYF